jgi:peptidyl-prolyl cis-trans isomerase C
MRPVAYALFLSILASSHAAHAQADKPVAKVDGITITEADLTLAAEDPALNMPSMGEAQKREVLINYVVDLKLGASAAESAKIADTATFQNRLAYLRQKTLVDEYLDQQVKKAMTPEAARKLYDETVKTMKPEEEVRARHILLENEEDAKKASVRLKGGEDFIKLAEELSKDPGSKKDGGDLGFFTRDRMVAPFADTAFRLQPGQVSDPVKTQFGWHIIKVEDKRTQPIPPFEQMKEQIESYLARKTQQDAILALRAKAKIERLDQPTEAPKATNTAPKPSEEKKP